MGAANVYGTQLHQAVDLLREAARTGDPVVVLSVTQRGIASALKVITRADDSSGIIGDACRDLLALHTETAAPAGPDGQADRLDDHVPVRQRLRLLHYRPGAYASALGKRGMASYRARLDDIAARLGPRPGDSDSWSSGHSYEWLAVLDCDVEAIIRTHARDLRVAAWLEDTAEALEEIGRLDLAIDWAKQATDRRRPPVPQGC